MKNYKPHKGESGKREGDIKNENWHPKNLSKRTVTRQWKYSKQNQKTEKTKFKEVKVGITRLQSHQKENIKKYKTYKK